MSLPVSIDFLKDYIWVFTFKIELLKEFYNLAESIERLEVCLLDTGGISCITTDFMNGLDVLRFERVKSTILSSFLMLGR